jgi:hypothetical protein
MALPHPAAAAAAARALRCCTVGFPRIGACREVKFALEAFWAGASSEEDMLATVHAAEAAALKLQRDAGAPRRTLRVSDERLHLASSACACVCAARARIRTGALRRTVCSIGIRALACVAAAFRRRPLVRAARTQ